MAGGIPSIKPKQMRRRRYPGMARGELMQSKYGNCERVKINRVGTRKLTPAEIDEWYARLRRIMDPGYVVVEVKTRRAIV
jgi:hypothetical protein